MKDSGGRRTPKATAHADSRSIRTGQSPPCSTKKALAWNLLHQRLPRTTPSTRRRRFHSINSGCSRTQGTHHEAKKLINTHLEVTSSISNDLPSKLTPSTWGTSSPINGLFDCGPVPPSRVASNSTKLNRMIPAAPLTRRTERSLQRVTTPAPSWLVLRVYELQSL